MVEVHKFHKPVRILQKEKEIFAPYLIMTEFDYFLPKDILKMPIKTVIVYFIRQIAFFGLGIYSRYKRLRLINFISQSEYCRRK